MGALHRPAPGFAGERDDGATLALSPDGTRLFVSDLTIGQVAEVDTDAVRFLRAADLGPVNAGVPPVSKVLADGRLLIGDGAQVVSVDTTDLQRDGQWYPGGSVTQLDQRPDGHPVAVLDDELLVLDPERHDAVERLPLDAALGTLPPPAIEVPPLQCAC